MTSHTAAVPAPAVPAAVPTAYDAAAAAAAAGGTPLIFRVPGSSETKSLIPLPSSFPPPPAPSAPLQWRSKTARILVTPDLIPSWHTPAIQAALRDSKWTALVASTASRVGRNLVDSAAPLVLSRFPALSPEQSFEIVRLCSGWYGFREDGRTASMIGADPYQVEAEVLSRAAFRQSLEARRRTNRRRSRSPSPSLSDDGDASLSDDN